MTKNHAPTMDDIEAYMDQYPWKTGDGRNLKTKVVKSLRVITDFTGLSPAETLELLEKANVKSPEIQQASKVVGKTLEWLHLKGVPTLDHLNAYWNARCMCYAGMDRIWMEYAVGKINHIVGEHIDEITVSEAVSLMNLQDISDVPQRLRFKSVRELYEAAPETRLSCKWAAEELIRDLKRDYRPNGPHGKPRISITPIAPETVASMHDLKTRLYVRAMA